MLPPDLRPLVETRKAELARRRRMRAPDKLGTFPEADESSGKEEGEAEEERGMTGTTLKGVSASRGQVTGRAVLAKPGKERPQVRPGDILVAQNVGPEWTPAFGFLGGLVLDHGDLGQHAALIARECRMPSVMQTQ